MRARGEASKGGRARTHSRRHCASTSCTSTLCTSARPKPGMRRGTRAGATLLGAPLGVPAGPAAEAATLLGGVAVLLPSPSGPSSGATGDSGRLACEARGALPLAAVEERASLRASSASCRSPSSSTGSKARRAAATAMGGEAAAVAASGAVSRGEAAGRSAAGASFALAACSGGLSRLSSRLMDSRRARVEPVTKAASERLPRGPARAHATHAPRPELERAAGCGEGLASGAA